jgi:broad specificity phosphatase PhoE
VTTHNHTPTDRLTVSDLLTHPRKGQTDLYLVRHGQTAGNVKNLFIGATDIPLDELGQRQVVELGERFRGIRLDDIFTSPLQRARRTAEAIGRVTGHDPIVVPGLSETDFGDAEGLTYQQVIEQFPELLDDLRDLEKVDFAFPGGETRRAFYERVTAAFMGIIERYEGKSVAVVAHGGVIGTFYAQLHPGPHTDMAKYAVANASIGHLIIGAEHTRIELWNDVSHLTEVIQI